MQQPPTSIPPIRPRVAQARNAPMPPGSVEPPQAPYMASHMPQPPQPPQPPQLRKDAKPAKRGRSKITNGLVALSSAAILSVYAVGYTHTQSADAQASGATPPAQAVVAAQGIPPTAIVSFTPTASGGNGGYFLLASPTPNATAAPAVSIASVATAAAPTALAPTSAPTAPPAANTAAIPPRAPAALPTTVPTSVPTRAAVATPTPAPRATATPAAVVAVTGKYRNGSYTGTGTSRRGDIEVLVVVQGGKITSAEITQCNTSYSCTRIAALPGQVVAKQSANVNNVSRATYSTQAYQGAVADALAQAAP